MGVTAAGHARQPSRASLDSTRTHLRPRERLPDDNFEESLELESNTAHERRLRPRLRLVSLSPRRRVAPRTTNAERALGGCGLLVLGFGLCLLAALFLPRDVDGDTVALTIRTQVAADETPSITSRGHPPPSAAVFGTAMPADSMPPPPASQPHLPLSVTSPSKQLLFSCPPSPPPHPLFTRPSPPLPSPPPPSPSLPPPSLSPPPKTPPSPPPWPPRTPPKVCSAECARNVMPTLPVLTAHNVLQYPLWHAYIAKVYHEPLTGCVLRRS